MRRLTLNAVAAAKWKKKREKNTWSPLCSCDPSLAGDFFAGWQFLLLVWGEGATIVCKVFIACSQQCLPLQNWLAALCLFLSAFLTYNDDEYGLQVAERSLFLWNNDHIVSLIAQNRSVIFPIIFEALEKNMQGHWNQAVHGLTANVRKMFLDMDSELFEACQLQYIEKEENAKSLEEQRESAWRRLEAIIEAKAGEDMVVAN
ncbi:hypothetical protein B296_00020399 [Ensete ventricosum]|uniref:Uncharacterized protein n=1 Tax=Ensete ventricosum TaxID=4639 RepID=A0A427B1F3_ENSVE|nr:hypothetical protein B296_00020399 [Ensete ventricosum]